jgi:AcrR family transcriptional regulator
MPRPRRPGQLGRILDAAEETFSRVGLQRATMSTIAEAAGLSAATLYHYFENKDALYRWTLRRAVRPHDPLPEVAPLPSLDATESDQLLEWLWRTADTASALRNVLEQESTEPPAEELRSQLINLYDRTWETRRVVNLLEARVVTTPQQWNKWYAEYSSRAVEDWANFFRARPSLLPVGEDPAEAAVFVLSSCTYFARKRLRRIEPNEDDHAYRAAIVNLLVNSLSRKVQRSA